MNKIFGILFILTGVFAIAGALYTWGDGSLFSQNELMKVWIPWADIVLTGPISLVGGYAILKKYAWGTILGLVTSGIYVFGSILVFIDIIWNDDYSAHLIIPAFAGFSIAVGFVIVVIQRRINLPETPQK